ncbi:MAG TPA: response regulator, partial [Ideonella sp.]|nr:response regulator [Ideonella sp.]
VYGFVKQSGGEITLDSRPGEGTRVTLAFPAVEPVPPSPTASAPGRPVAPALQGLRLLVVDDDEAFRATLLDTLAGAGAQGRGVASAEAALATLVADPLPDAVLSDICLAGGQDGLRLAAELRTRWPELPMVLMSGLPPELSPRTPAAWPGGIAFLQKPFTLAALCDALQAALKAGAGGDVSRVEQHS